MNRDTTVCTRVNVRVQTRSSKTRLEWHEDMLKVYLNAPPVDGAANEALTTLLAARLAIPKRAITIVRGASSRQKLLEIVGMTLDQFIQKIGPV